MRFRLLGRSGLRVSELALGTMTFGEAWGWGASKDESRRIFDAYAEAGGNFVDTACNYTDGESERFLGEFLRSDRDHFVVATKYTLTSRREDPNAGGNQRKNLVTTLEGSLERLGTDYLDLLWLHMWDGMTPVEESVADLWATGVSPDGHPTRFLRERLTELGVVTATGLWQVTPGHRVLVAGIVTHRQRPMTAQGTTFLNLEDETGLVNVVCSKGCWARYRRVARDAAALLVRGRLERSEGVINVIADRLDPLPVAASAGSRDFR